MTSATDSFARTSSTCRSVFNWLSTRRREVGLIAIFAFLLVVFFYTFLLVVFTDTRPIGHLNTGDSNNLVSGTRVALDCLRAGHVFDCGPSVGPYPLLQYLPSAVLVELGLSDDQILGVLGTISFLAVLLLLLATLAVFRTRPKVATLLILMLLPTSLMYQSTSAFGEALTASLVGAAVLAAISRRPLLLFALVVAASLGKETLAPFVVLLALVCARSASDGLLPSRKLTIAAAGGGLAGIAICLAFNVFRFGTVRNVAYLDPILRTPGVGRKAEFFAGIVASPAAGVVWYWPVLALVTSFGAARGIRQLTQRPHDLRNGLPVLSVLGVMLGWFALLSLWFAPFGWEAYGPRLAVPVLVGGAVAIAHVAGESVIEFIARRRLALAAVGSSLAVGCIQFGAPWRWSNSMAQLFGTPTGPCSESPVAVHPAVDADLYYRCVSEMMWRRSPLVVDEVIDFSASVAGSAWLLAVAGSFMLLWFVGSGNELHGLPGGHSEI
ncbi:MAG: hypothetical protein HY826_00765 [Actinobacteria bacterium]|nr:hypothetical protein [Actinomycetota bacterium]